MPRSLEKSSIIVVGGSGGIGAEVTRDLTRRGARVTVVGRNPDTGVALCEDTGATWVQADVTQSAEVDRAIETVAAEHGIDGVVHAVGSILLRPAHLLKDADIHDTITTNLTSAMFVVRAASKRMMRSGGGNIVLFSTAAAQVGFANHEAIAAAKGGVEGLARAAAASYAKRGIRVNVVAPGLVRTPLSARITGNAGALETSTRMHALGRIGEPDDIAHAVRFLLETTWTTGQTLVVDGGLAGIA